MKELNPSPHALAKATVSGSTITLDGTGSKDDGTIVNYRWLSDTRRPDQKTGRYAPPDLSPAQAAGWPGDGPIVTVPNVPEGWWVFTLWVTDDKGVIGDPSTVVVAVGNPTGPMPGAAGAPAPAAGGAGGSSGAVGGATGTAGR